MKFDSCHACDNTHAVLLVRHTSSMSPCMERGEGKRAAGKVECRLQWGRGNKSNVHGNDLSNNCMN